MYKEAKITSVLPSTDLYAEVDCRNLIDSPHIRKSSFILLQNQKKGCRKNKYSEKKENNNLFVLCVQRSLILKLTPLRSCTNHVEFPTLAWFKKYGQTQKATLQLRSNHTDSQQSDLSPQVISQRQGLYTGMGTMDSTSD